MSQAVTHVKRGGENLLRQFSIIDQRGRLGAHHNNHTVSLLLVPLYILLNSLPSIPLFSRFPPCCYHFILSVMSFLQLLLLHHKPICYCRTSCIIYVRIDIEAPHNVLAQLGVKIESMIFAPGQQLREKTFHNWCHPWQQSAVSGWEIEGRFQITVTDDSILWPAHAERWAHIFLPNSGRGIRLYRG